jgi:hypothetical protein
MPVVAAYEISSDSSYLLPSGIYEVYENMENGSHLGLGGGAYTIFHSNQDSGEYMMQIAHPYGEDYRGHLYFRYTINGSFTAWQKIVNQALDGLVNVEAKHNDNLSGLQFGFVGRVDQGTLGLSRSAGDLVYNNNVIYHAGNKTLLPKANSTTFGVVKTQYNSTTKTLNIITE